MAHVVQITDKDGYTVIGYLKGTYLITNDLQQARTFESEISADGLIKIH
jgi:hypothetical protein